MILQISQAYLFLEYNNVVHRDIKSHNILLKENFKILLCDFGLARYKKDLLTGSNLYAGTAAYMAPEMFNKKPYNEKVDVFAYGTLLWEILTRRIPYEGYEPLQIKGFVCEGRELPINEYFNKKDKIPQELINIVKLCRVVNPSERPSFKEINDKLVEIQSGYFK